MSKQILAYLETIACISLYFRQDDISIFKYDSIHAANLKRCDQFGYTELHRKIAVNLAKWVEMFPHKDYKGLTLPDEDDEGGDDSVELEASGGASGSAAGYTIPVSNNEED